MSEVVHQIEDLQVVPVVAIEDRDDANPLADALNRGGLSCAEVTLRSEAALDVIRELAKRSDFLVGAGTVHNAEQAARAVEAGARFIVTPGFNPKTVAWSIQNDIPVFPGTSIPTDLELALEFGLQSVKFFPAEALGGVKMLKAFYGPYRSLRFMPTGGITSKNLPDYLRLPNVLACGGSWMVHPQLISEGRFDEVTRLTEETMQLIHDLRSPSKA